MRNVDKDIKEWVDVNKEANCSICGDKMFSGTNSRSFTYLDCCRNSGSSKGHAYHASCLAEHYARSMDLDSQYVPGDYKCPLCKSSSSMIHFPEMRLKSDVLSRV